MTAAGIEVGFYVVSLVMINYARLARDRNSRPANQRR